LLNPFRFIGYLVIFISLCLGLVLLIKPGYFAMDTKKAMILGILFVGYALFRTYRMIMTTKTRKKDDIE